jgi:hypothetical protein
MDTSEPQKNEVTAAAATPVRWRSVAVITVAAVAIYAGFRALPTGTNLHHLDFQVQGAGALEMCDPTRPQFIPVVEARSPVRLELNAATGRVGEAKDFVLRLTTAGGKPIGPVDLINVHTRKLHLLVVDETLADYQHLHPEPGAKAGEWIFSHTPQRAGVYRVFADFTPAATARGLYSFTDYTVAAAENVEGSAVRGEFSPPEVGAVVSREGYELELRLGQAGALKAGEAGVLTFSVASRDGAAVPLEEVMASFVHLVAFDAGRSGFAHLHPRVEAPGAERAAEATPQRRAFVFDVMIPQPGRYVVWAQLKVAGAEWFQPFALTVVR